MSENEKAELAHWESAWAARPRLRFPSGLNIGTRNVSRLLGQYSHAGMRYVEVGCAPRKILSWALNFAAYLQPADIKGVCPLMVLEATRASDG